MNATNHGEPDTMANLLTPLSKKQQVNFNRFAPKPAKPRPALSWRSLMKNNAAPQAK